MKKFWDSNYLGEEAQEEPSAFIVKEKKDGILPKILSFVALFIVIALVVGTAAAFASKKASFASGLRKTDPKPSERNSVKYGSYMDLGHLRLLTADENVVLILEPWFSYSDGSSDFAEEISSKSRAIKIEITSYFHSHTKQELLSAGENTVKAQLLKKINDMLILGSFSDIYFSEYLFLN